MPRTKLTTKRNIHDNVAHNDVPYDDFYDEQSIVDPKEMMERLRTASTLSAEVVKILEKRKSLMQTKLRH